MGSLVSRVYLIGYLVAECPNSYRIRADGCTDYRTYKAYGDILAIYFGLYRICDSVYLYRVTICVRYIHGLLFRVCYAFL